MLSPTRTDVQIAANLEHDPRRGRVLLAGELLTAAEARALGERLLRAASELELILAVVDKEAA